MPRKALANGRSANQRFIKLHEGVTGSDAYQALSVFARAILIEVWRRHDGTNNGSIPYSERDGKTALGTGRRQVREALAQLVEHGFLIKHQKGSFSTKVRHAAEWEITPEPHRDGSPAKHLYRSWQKKSSGTSGDQIGYPTGTRKSATGTSQAPDVDPTGTREGPFDPPHGYPTGTTYRSTIGGGSDETAIKTSKLPENGGRPKFDPAEQPMPDVADLEGPAD